MWADDDLRSAFVAGAAWWEFHREEATMWQSDIVVAEAEAERRFPDGTPYYMGGEAKEMILIALRAMSGKIKHSGASDWQNHMKYDKLVAMFNPSPTPTTSPCTGAGSGWCPCPPDTDPDGEDTTP